jgi:hypothetical protein
MITAPTLEAVEAAYAAWREESDRPGSTYRSRMDAYNAATVLLLEYKVAAQQERNAREMVR